MRGLTMPARVGARNPVPVESAGASAIGKRVVVADIFDEVDEELRRDRAKVLWDKYGKLIIAAAVLIVIATSANVFWRNYTEQQRLENARAFMEATVQARAGEVDQAIDGFVALAAEGQAGYALIARFRAAALKAENGDLEGAIADYAALAADGDLDPIYRDLATLMRVISEADTGDPGTLIQDLEPLAAEARPWRHTAREFTAVQHLRQGKTAEARQTLTMLADDLEAPRGIRARASEMLRALEQ